MQKFKYIILILKVSISLALIVFLAKNVNFVEIIELLTSIKVNYIFAAILVLMVQILIANIRWIIVLNALNFSILYVKLLQYLWIGIFFNQMLPSSIGGDAARIYYLKTTGGNTKQAVLGVFLDRFFGILSLSFLAWLLILLPSSLSGSVSQTGFLVSFVVFLLACLLFVLNYLPFNLPDWRIVRALTSAALTIRNVFWHKNHRMSLSVISICIHLLTVLVFIILSEGMNLNIDWLDILSIIPLATLLTLIPISIAGWGLREGIMVMFMGYIGVSAEQSLTLSIVYGLLVLITSIPGGFFWMFNHGVKMKNFKQ